MADITHGSISAYTNHRCRCEACRTAQKAYQATARLRRASGPMPDRIHGTNNGYTNYACRCAACLDAHLEAKRA